MYHTFGAGPDDWQVLVRAGEIHEAGGRGASGLLRLWQPTVHTHDWAAAVQAAVQTDVQQRSWRKQRGHLPGAVMVRGAGQVMAMFVWHTYCKYGIGRRRAVLLHLMPAASNELQRWIVRYSWP